MTLALALTGSGAGTALARPGAPHVRAAARTARPVVWSPVRHIRVGRISIGYRRIGSGPPLVMIMGFGGTMAEWDPALLTRLGARRTVIVFDNRGVATSTDTPRNRLTIGEMADDTWRLIGRLRLRPTDVLGWSMGSFIAQILALRHPCVIRRLILSGADPGSRHAVQASARVNRILANPNTTIPQLIKLLFPRNQQQAGFDYIHRVGLQPGLQPDSFTVSKHILAAQNVANGRLWYCRGCGAYERLPKIKLATLVADGANDIVEPTVNSRVIARRIPRAKLRIFTDSGHAFMFQYFSQFSRVALGFLTAR
jgi:pimeloyl-ACP methyl ester carboxylesterase